MTIKARLNAVVLSFDPNRPRVSPNDGLDESMRQVFARLTSESRACLLASAVDLLRVEAKAGISKNGARDA